MLTKQHQEELISLSYMHAVAAITGTNLNTGDVFDYGMDIGLKQMEKVGDSIFPTGIQFELQLKSTINWRDRGDFVSYYMDGTAYNRVLFRNTRNNTAPILLGVMCLPREKGEWVSFAPEEMILRRCCYWMRLTGPQTAKKKIVVRIPKHQVLTPLSIRSLFQMVEDGAFAR